MSNVTDTLTAWWSNLTDVLNFFDAKKSIICGGLAGLLAAVSGMSQGGLLGQSAKNSLPAPLAAWSVFLLSVAHLTVKHSEAVQTKRTARKAYAEQTIQTPKE
jgi:hypothetical protein